MANKTDVKNPDVDRLVKPVNARYAGWRAVSGKILGGIADRKVKTDVNRMAWIGDHYRAAKSLNGWADVPSFSVRDTTAAETAGFDTSKTCYHGTTAKDFKTFRVGHKTQGVNELGVGNYFTGDPDVAHASAGRHPDQGGRIISAYLKRCDLFDKSQLRMAFLAYRRSKMPGSGCRWRAASRPTTR